MTKTKERPILFSGEMVRAVLDGRKTQTRRVMLPRPGKNQHMHNPPLYGTGVSTNKGQYGVLMCEEITSNITLTQHFKCPYGAPGDRLWVRETFAYITDSFAIAQGVRYKADHVDKFFKADGNLIPDGATVFNSLSHEYPDIVKYRPSIHMPRWASRIQIEVVDVRVERVQDISEEDAIREGISAVDSSGNDINPIEYEYRKWFKNYETGEFSFIDPVASFWSLWNSINEKRGFGWDTNPWVWVVEFRRVK